MSTILAEAEKQLRKIAKAGKKRVDALNELAWQVAGEDQPWALKKSNEALELAIKLGYDAGRAYAQRNISYCDLIEGRLEDAFKSGIEAMATFVRLEDELGQCTTSDSLTHVYISLGNYDKALEAALRALKLSQKLEFERGIAYGYFNLAIIDGDTGKFDSGIENLKQAARKFEKIDYEPGLAWVMVRWGELYEKSKNYHEAIKTLEEATELGKKNNLGLVSARALTSMVSIRLAEQNATEAFQLLQRLEKDFGRTGGDLLKATRLRLSAVAFRQQGQFDEALDLLQQAAGLAEKANNRPELLECYNELSAVSEEVGELKEALQALRKSQEIRSDIFNETSQNKLANMRMQHKVEQALQERELERLRDVEQAEKKLRKAHREVKKLRDQLVAENISLQEDIKLEHNFFEIISQSETMKQVLFSVQQVAQTDATVLVTGESGTGKELLARAIHEASGRAQQSLVKINCAALPADLVESELFGNEKGAFTGADAARPGRFEIAHQGTIFLDEIAEFPLNLQAKLLRVLQEGEFDKLGSKKTTRVDVRVIAATNRNLAEEVEAGRFRKDLFYRLNVFPLQCPALRERLEDIPLLVQYFLQKHAKRLGRNIKSVPRKNLNALLQYHWPGNIRELENLVERALILSQGNKIDFVSLLPAAEVSQSYSLTLAENEKKLIEMALKKSGGTIKGDGGAAKILGIAPSSLRDKIKKYQLN